MKYLNHLATSPLVTLSLAVIVSIIFTSSASAATRWTNTLADDDINNAANWDAGLPSDADGLGIIVDTVPLVLNQAFMNGGDNDSEFFVAGTPGVTIEAGTSLRYFGDGLFGTSAFSAGGATVVNQTGGTLIQDGGGAGLLISHNADAEWNISGGSIIVETTSPSLTIDHPAGGSQNGVLNISGTGLVDVESDFVLGPAGTLNVSDSGKLIWRNATLADVAGLGGTINALATEVGSDIEFVAGSAEEFFLKLLVNRDSGAMEIQNNTGSVIEIASYSITSSAGTLDYDNWNSVADSDSNWDEFTATGSKTDLSEGTVGSLSLADNGAIQLDNGTDTTWIQYFDEDELSFVYENATSGEIETGLVRYAGNGDSAFLEGDLDFSGGNPDSADWDAFVAAYGSASLDGLSQAEAYVSADLDNDGVHSHGDFLQFKISFDAANGAGAFASLSAVPEPTTLGLSFVALLGGMFATRRPRGASPLVTLSLAMIVSIIFTSSASAVTRWRNTLADGDINNAANWDAGLPSDADGLGIVVDTVPLVLNQAFMNGGDNDSEFFVAGTPGVTIEAGTSLRYFGDGLFGTSILGVGGATVVNQTGGSLIQDGGGAGLLISHNADAEWNISGGSIIVETTSPSLTIDHPAGGSQNGVLNISGTGLVDVESNFALGPAGTLNVSDSGMLIWRNRTLADVTGLGGTINAIASEVGSDVHFLAIPEPTTLVLLGVFAVATIGINRVRG